MDALKLVIPGVDGTLVDGRRPDTLSGIATGKFRRGQRALLESHDLAGMIWRGIS